jgi:hypothetical protein
MPTRRRWSPFSLGYPVVRSTAPSGVCLACAFAPQLRVLSCAESPFPPRAMRRKLKHLRRTAAISRSCRAVFGELLISGSKVNRALLNQVDLKCEDDA